MKIRLHNWIFALGIFCVGSSWAQELQVGAHVGAIGTQKESKIGFGLQFGVNPDGVAAFLVDVTMAPFSAGTYFSSSPAIVVYPVAQEEFSLGLLGGAGFYRIPGETIRFGLNFGATGDFALNTALSVGMESRYHPIFGTPNDVWSVFMTVKYRFEGDGGW